MAQRGSGYERQPDELYETPRWVAAVIGQWLREAGVRSVWEPAPGSGRFAGYLRDEGCEVTTTAGDFFSIEKIPKVEAIVTNPPYGERLDAPDALYRDMAQAFARLHGWRVAVLAGAAAIERAMRRRADKALAVWNGDIECRLLLYDVP